MARQQDLQDLYGYNPDEIPVYAQSGYEISTDPEAQTPPTSPVYRKTPSGSSNSGVNGPIMTANDSSQGTDGSEYPPPAEPGTDTNTQPEGPPRTPRGPTNPTNPPGQPTVPPTPPPPPGGTGGNETQDKLYQLLNKLLEGQLAQQSDTSFRDKIRGTVSGLMDKYSKDPTPNDADIKAPTDAFRTEQIRNMRFNREAMAERANAQGLPTGALDSAIESGMEGVGRNTGAYGAGLLSQKFGDYGNRLSDALRMGAGFLSDEESRALQDRIATLGAAGNANRDIYQNNQFYDNLGLNVANQQSALERILFTLLMSGAGG